MFLSICLGGVSSGAIYLPETGNQGNLLKSFLRYKAALESDNSQGEVSRLLRTAWMKTGGEDLNASYLGGFFVIGRVEQISPYSRSVRVHPNRKLADCGTRSRGNGILDPGHTRKCCLVI